MPFLTASQRNTLEKTVTSARRLAQTGARNALHALSIDEAEPYAHLTADQRDLRRLLRHRARLLGDALRSDGRQAIDHLAYELAYEYWHRMLFAQFLAVNHLLLYEPGVPVSLAECEELAADEGYADKWAAAASYASRMLPAIFRPDDPLLRVDFAREDRIHLEVLLDNLDEGISGADDALGWVYQFWQSDAKDAINKSGDKINGERLPAVTQLFTEPYMVHFLIDNTIGAWWTDRHPTQTPPVPFRYLRTPDRADDETPEPRFAQWPDTTAQLTVLDPCMGSGHIVAEVFRTLVALRQYEEGLSTAEAVARVLTDNLHGLELDPRCTQIAAFNLALTAWRLIGHYHPLPVLNLACSGLAPTGRKEDWMRLVGTDARLRNGMADLYDLFQQAPELGSLLDPNLLQAGVVTASFDELQPVLRQALAAPEGDEQQERGVVALGIAQAGKLLARRYTLQLTNVPYLAINRQEKTLSEYCQRHFADAKYDLATVFLDRMLRNADKGGTVSTVLPQNWLFLARYRSFRERLLKSKQWNFVARLGPGAFQEITGEVVKAALISVSNAKPDEESIFIGLDVSDSLSALDKDSSLRTTDTVELNQQRQLKNPDARVVLEQANKIDLLAKYAHSLRGIVSGDKDYWFRSFWEVPQLGNDWRFLQSTVSTPQLFGGKEQIVDWRTNGRGMLRPGLDNIAYGRAGIALGQMGSLPWTLHNSEMYDNNTGVIVPKDPEHLPAIWAFCSSPQFNIEVRKIDQALKVTNATLVQVPFDLDHWQRVAAAQYPAGLPAPYSDDPTQWLFHGHPVGSTAPLQVAVARLLGYRWPAESDPDMDLSAEGRARIAAIRPFDALTDDDGILCLSPVNGELSAADKLREYLQAVYGPGWSADTPDALLRQAGSGRANLDAWLREEFMDHHNRLFGNRPFIWHVWDGRRDGFGALVNYHTLTADNLQRLIYTYLGDYLRQGEARVKSGESGAEGQLSAGRALQDKLKRILEGEAPYDVFVRWKPLDRQPLGWQPDLNDGVRLNIRPFLEADVLRKRPNVKWGIDRGRNAPGAPWGDLRDNDPHLTLTEKRAGRL